MQNEGKDSLFIAQLKFTYRIQPKDLLNIQVISPDPRVSSFYNIQSNQQGNAQIMATPASAYITGYLVSDSGYIYIPVIGKIMVKGFSISEAQENIEKIIREQVNNATVVVKLLNFRITILGEVRSPGMHYMYNEQFTLLEAIGTAGDITEFGNRKKIKLLRQEPGGVKIIYLDMTSESILTSPYFYLKPNDVLYVAPLKAKIDRNNLGQITLVFAGISTLLLLINFFKKS